MGLQDVDEMIDTERGRSPWVLYTLDVDLQERILFQRSKHKHKFRSYRDQHLASLGL